MTAQQPRISVWWYMGERRARKYEAAHLAALKALNVSRVCIMLNAQEDVSFGLTSWTYQGAVWWARLLRERGIRTTLTVWPRPLRAYIDALLQVIPKLATDCGPSGEPAEIELDCEGANWTRFTATDFENNTQAGACLAEGFKAYQDVGGRWGTTTISTGPARSISSFADYVVPQAYSIWDPKKAKSKAKRNKDYTKLHGWDGIYGPGSRQKVAVDKHSFLEIPIIMGLPAWAQEYPGHEEHEAMERAWQATMALGIKDVRYWAWSKIVGLKGRTRDWAYDFLKSKA